MTIHKAKGKEFDGIVLVEGAFVSQLFDTNREQPPYQRCRRLLRSASRAPAVVSLSSDDMARRLSLQTIIDMVLPE
jgi:DNA helicase-2/ATP-dependent DNA helicase PcrA